MKLGNLSDIRTGLVLSRKKTKMSSEGSQKYQVLTLKSFHTDGYIVRDELDDFYTDQSIGDEFITQEGDIVIRLSFPNTAVFIDATLRGTIIPSLFAIIRIRNGQVLPRYLQWLLNSTYVKRHIRKSQIGSAIPVIQTSFLNELPIKLLPIAQQEKIAAISQLFLQEKMLLTKLIREKESLYQRVISMTYEGKVMGRKQ